MSAIEELRSYLGRLRGRFRLGAMLRGGAIVAAIALIATLVLAVVINRFEFSTPSVWSARAALLLALALAAVFGLAMPLWRLGRRWWTRRAEGAFPQFEQRLQTFAEQDATRSDPFLELLAADTLRVAHTADVEAAVPRAALIASAAIGLASLATLAWLIHSGPGYFGYAAAALWTGPGPQPPYDVRVAPGDATVRRHADQLVTAELHGLQRDGLTIHVRYGAAAKWEQTGMQPRPGASGFQFLFASVPGDLEYFVSAGPVQTRHFHLHVVDVPVVREIRVSYRHPQWMNIPDSVAAHGGDLRAIEGTQAQLEIVTDRPLAHGVLVMDDGRRIALTAGSGNLSHGSIPIQRDGSYHIAARIGGIAVPGARGDAIRISDDYFIEAGAVKPPEVALVRPAGDYPASPIEEVTVAATAQDDFGLSEFALHYSVNGGPEKTLDLLKAPGEKSATGTAMIPLESLKLVPGDVIGIYAAARDPRVQAHSAISFIQVDPFEREFSQSQQSGGGAGGGMADDQAQIAQREKEIIAATWKQEGLRQSPQKQAGQQAAEQAKFLSEVQDTLRGQASSLAGRLGMRDLQSANEQFGSFQQEMTAAAAAMAPASQQLGNQQWRAAVAQEQKALQHLLRAEATFRQIEVAFGSRGGGSGSVNSAGRDLASLFDLELDTQKNQYETAQTASPASQQAGQVDEALRKLDELARRQNELAMQRGNNAAQEAQARWEQEMLRRKADELQQQLQQLQQMAQGSPQQGGSSAPGSSGAPGASGSQGSEQGAEGGEPRTQGANGGASAADAMREALAQLRQAQDDMRHAVDSHDGMDARRAAERLRQATSLLAGVRQQDVSRQLDSLGQQTAELAARQREQSERLSALRTWRGASEMRRERMRPGAPGSPRSSDGPGEGAGDPVERLIADRQKLVTDLGHLTQALRAARREALEHNRAAAGKLHQALGDLEQSDTETHLQRSADLLRRGYAPLTDDAESQIAADLRHLQDQIAGARAALAQGQDASQDALDQLGRLRSQLAALDPGLQGAKGQREGGAAPNGAAGESAAGDAAAGGRSAGPVSGVGAVTGTGGYREGPVEGAWNSGVDPRRSGPVGPGRIAPVAPPAQTRQAFQQGMSELGRLQRSVADDPQARQQVDELIRSMQRLDPRRFPGNPAMVEELYAQVLSGVDKLELQLRHEPADDQPGQVRAGNPEPVPPGYQAAVADYFRRLSTPPGAAGGRASGAGSGAAP